MDDSFQATQLVQDGKLEDDEVQKLLDCLKAHHVLVENTAKLVEKLNGTRDLSATQWGALRSAQEEFKQDEARLKTATEQLATIREEFESVMRQSDPTHLLEETLDADEPPPQKIVLQAMAIIMRAERTLEQVLQGVSPQVRNLFASSEAEEYKSRLVEVQREQETRNAKTIETSSGLRIKIHELEEQVRVLSDEKAALKENVGKWKEAAAKATGAETHAEGLLSIEQTNLSQASASLQNANARVFKLENDLQQANELKSTAEQRVAALEMSVAELRENATVAATKQQTTEVARVKLVGRINATNRLLQNEQTYTLYLLQEIEDQKNDIEALQENEGALSLALESTDFERLKAQRDEARAANTEWFHDYWRLRRKLDAMGSQRNTFILARIQDIARVKAQDTLIRVAKSVLNRNKSTIEQTELALKSNKSTLEGTILALSRKNLSLEETELILEEVIEAMGDAHIQHEAKLRQVRRERDNKSTSLSQAEQNMETAKQEIKEAGDRETFLKNKFSNATRSLAQMIGAIVAPGTQEQPVWMSLASIILACPEGPSPTNPIDTPPSIVLRTKGHPYSQTFEQRIHATADYLVVIELYAMIHSQPLHRWETFYVIDEMRNRMADCNHHVVPYLVAAAYKKFAVLDKEQTTEMAMLAIAFLQLIRCTKSRFSASLQDTSIDTNGISHWIGTCSGLARSMYAMLDGSMSWENILNDESVAGQERLVVPGQMTLISKKDSRNLFICHDTSRILILSKDLIFRVHDLDTPGVDQYLIKGPPDFPDGQIDMAYPETTWFRDYILEGMDIPAEHMELFNRLMAGQ